MNHSFNARTLLDFYKDHLMNVLLPFWLRAVDWEDGGYYNCYDNTGSTLISNDKYAWSQGRFVWIYAKLASMETGMFSEEQRQRFLVLAEHGANFLMKHVLLDNGNCTFLMDKQGRAKRSAPHAPYDASIFADCFVMAGLAQFSAVSKDKASFQFAQKLYTSIMDRIQCNTFTMEPYATPEGYKSHNIPMILLNVTHELLEAVNVQEGSDREDLIANMKHFLDEIMNQFVDEHGILNEMISLDHRRVDTRLGRYCNPGHSIEDMWFVIHASKRLKLDSYMNKAFKTTKKMVELGWDHEYGGILLFVDREGGQPRGDISGVEHTAMVKQIEQNWDNKLWWPHSEALYTTLLCYKLTGDRDFLRDYEKIHEYTFRTFPNSDKQVGEWIQIRKRNGEAINKVVALPVKDPYHIVRNFVYIIELLHGMLNKDCSEVELG